MTAITVGRVTGLDLGDPLVGLLLGRVAALASLEPAQIVAFATGSDPTGYSALRRLAFSSYLSNAR